MTKPDTDKPTKSRNWWIAWTTVYLLNLPLLLFFGYHVTDSGGWIGMFVGVVICWGVGQAICLCEGNLRWALVTGAKATFVLQGFPIVHVIVGGCAVELVEAISGSDFHPYATLRVRLEMMGLAATILTAQPLMVLAIAFGYIAYWTNHPATK